MQAYIKKCTVEININFNVKIQIRIEDSYTNELESRIDIELEKIVKKITTPTPLGIDYISK